jgi:Helicase associated domain
VFTEGTLDASRRARLEALPGWVWDQRDANWEEGFAALQRFVEREGHAGVPGGWREGGYRLGQWVSEQRHRHRRGALGLERRARLEALSGWTWSVREAAWEESFAALERFVEREGHARVATDQHLGKWVSKQRDRYVRSRLDPERRTRLEALPGWVWGAPEAAWDERFAALQRFVEREGHARVPYGHREDGYKLGHWVGTQRAFLKRGRLGESRRTRLESLPGWLWDPFEADWKEGFAVLNRFVEREGHARVPLSHREDGYRLGGWVGEQRTLGRQGRLAKDRARRLEALPGWVWEARER